MMVGNLNHEELKAGFMGLDTSYISNLYVSFKGIIRIYKLFSKEFAAFLERGES